MSNENNQLTYFNGNGLKDLKPLKKTNQEWVSKPNPLAAHVKYPVFPYLT